MVPDAIGRISHAGSERGRRRGSRGGSRRCGPCTASTARRAASSCSPARARRAGSSPSSSGCTPRTGAISPSASGGWAGTIRTQPHPRPRRRPTRLAGTDEGKPSVTHVRPVEHFGDAYTLVECRLETGRTHQIRIHMAETGHPVCGERVYSAPRHFEIVDESQAPRVMLHAAELGFVHPETGEELRFESPLPADMQSRALRATAFISRHRPACHGPSTRRDRPRRPRTAPTRRP